LKEAKQDLTRKPKAKDGKSKPSDFGGTQAKPHTKVMAIEEISDESEAEDEDLMMYEKPDTDASDSEEDPTLVQRSKPRPPVSVPIIPFIVC
jgi:telomere length regulation protein